MKSSVSDAATDQKYSSDLLYLSFWHLPKEYKFHPFFQLE